MTALLAGHDVNHFRQIDAILNGRKRRLPKGRPLGAR
jgi:hypothetical protein